MSRLGIITGMKAEADLLSAAARGAPEQSRPLIAAAGGNAGRAENAARGFAAAGVRGLVSFGIAGGLDPRLKSGDIILADTVLPPGDEGIATHQVWCAAFAAAFAAASVIEGTICGSDRAVSTPREKAKLFAQTGAVAVDMESHGVGRAAREAGLSLLVVRAIADSASRTIPNAAIAGLGEDGGRKPFAVIGKLLRHPTQLVHLIGVARDSKVALRRLAYAAPAILDTAEI